MFLNMANHLISFEDGGRALLAEVEDRWNALENILIFLAFLLHPQYRETAVCIINHLRDKKGNWSDDRNTLAVERLTHAAVFYYGKFCLSVSVGDEGKKKEIRSLKNHFRLWTKGTLAMVDECSAATEHYSHPVEWWDTLGSDEFPELSRLARFLLSAPVQSASVERVFKDLGRYQTKVRNRLSDESTLLATILKDDINKRGYEYDNIKSAAASKNRLVSSEELARVHSNAESSSEEPSSDEDAELEEDTDSEDESDDESSVDEDEDARPKWMDALLDLDEEDDESDYDSMLIEVSSVEGEEGTGSDDAEDSYESVEPDKNLPPLESDNFPQENAAYFANKRYVRSDKVALGDMIFADLSLPSIFTAFE